MTETKEHPARVNLIRSLLMVFSVAGLLATLFTAWTPLGLVPFGLSAQLQDVFNAPGIDQAYLALTPTSRPRPHIGIVAGHWQNDSGAVCADGLTEQALNLEIATLVRDHLIDEGFDVDLLAEFDPQLNGYQALALVSIHADSCEFINNEATGFKVAAALASAYPEKANRLTACLHSRYQDVTGLLYHPGSITGDMTNYHAFGEIHTDTTAAIIETGFMNLDRQFLTQHQEEIASGITEGILCYIYNQDAQLPTPTPQQ
jgi:N-acetylmuramoyl-L-alanine amidase